jgi:preprotein translocase subunit YajC
MHSLLALILEPEQSAPQGPVDGGTLPFLLLAIAGAFFLIVILPARRREKKERENLLTAMKKNDEVLTASGIIGIVAAMKDDEVVLKVDESSNVRLRVLKSSIVRILNPKEAPKATAEIKTPTS